LGRIHTRFLLSIYLFGVAQILSGCTSTKLISTTASISPATLSPSSAILLPGQTLQFTATGEAASLANPSWMVNGVPGGSPTTGTISSSGLYTAPTSPSSGTVQVSEANVSQGLTSLPVTITLFSTKNPFPGTVAKSNHPQVALYIFPAPQGASVQVQFGTTKNYGLTTWMQKAPLGGGAVAILVAGMRANTTYHMQAVVQLPGGQRVSDADHTFTTGGFPASSPLPMMTVQQLGGAGIAPGVELLDLFTAPKGQLAALATDMAGNVIWYYAMNPGEVPFPIKLLPNGHMLVVISNGLVTPGIASTSSKLVAEEIREIDLAGNVVYRLSLSDINTALGNGFSFNSLAALHHDIVKLPNGHLIILADYFPALPNQSGFSTVLGDALIDWDPQAQAPVWTWSAFDHIPVTHAPVDPVDWTHANAVVYSPDDGNLILSMRNQNWIVKINYQDGAGDGKILWRLGPDGDFTLPAGQAPIEWNYGQHYPTVLTPNSAGIFRLMFFNNGNGRLVDADNDDCGAPGFIACYSSVPTFELNETAGTAQVVSEDNLSPAYSVCCGNASQLANGDLEYDVAFDVHTPNQSYIQEVTEEQTPQLMWQLNVTGQLMYRGFRIPSLYPGVEWSQSAISAANAAVVKRPAQASTGQP
jgi:arylsulfate sulfotransferase